MQAEPSPRSIWPKGETSSQPDTLYLVLDGGTAVSPLLMRTSYEIKLDRFDKHRHDVKSALADYLADKPYLLTHEKDDKRQRIVWTITLTKPVPFEIGGMVGDAIHNLRSTLDNWVFEFSAGPKGEPLSKTGFPIFTDEKDWVKGTCCRNDHGSHRIRGLPNPLKAIVEACQPFKREPTWMDHIRDGLRTIHELDIRDKHQRLNIVAANVDMGYWTQPEGVGEQIGRFILKGLLELDTPATFLVLDFPTLHDFEMGVHPYPMLEVVVAEERTQRWEQPGQEVVSFLDSLYGSVAWILGSARQALQPLR